MWQERFREILNEEFQRAREKSPKLSMRQWADRIRVSSGALSEILAGRRKVTVDKARSIAASAGIPPTKLKALLALMGEPGDPERVIPSRREIEMVESWENFAICGMYELSGVEVDSSFIAKRLQLPEAEVEQRTLLLIQAGMIRVDEAGKRFRIRQNWDLRQGLEPHEVLKSRERMIRLSLDAVSRVREDASQFANYTFVGGKTEIDYVKAELLRLMNHLEAIGPVAKSTELIRFSFQLFPMNFTAPIKPSDVG